MNDTTLHLHDLVGIFFIKTADNLIVFIEKAQFACITISQHIRILDDWQDRARISRIFFQGLFQDRTLHAQLPFHIRMHERAAAALLRDRTHRPPSSWRCFDHFLYFCHTIRIVLFCELRIHHFVRHAALHEHRLLFPVGDPLSVDPPFFNR